MPTDIYENIFLGFVLMLVCILGIIGNSLSVVVLTRPEMKSSVNVLLLGLALADNLFLFSRIFSSGLNNVLLFFDIYDYEYFYGPFIHPAALAFGEIGEYTVIQSLSVLKRVFFIVSFGANLLISIHRVAEWKYQVPVHPLKLADYSTYYHAQYTILKIRF